MKWSYSEFEVDSSRICPSGYVYCPVASIRIAELAGEPYLRALIDTGADHTLVPFSIAERIGAELFEAELSSVGGISGHVVIVIPGQVELELINETESRKWNAVIGFAKFTSPEDECSVLGHAGV